MINYKTDLVSLILPTYNRADYWLPNRLNNIILQTYKDWELIIVDDCSTDNTEEVVKTFIDKTSSHNRIKYLKLNKNSRYPSIPRNIGICHSIGEYIAHIDDDSVCEQDKLEKLIQVLKEYPDSTLCYGQRRTIYLDGSQPTTRTMIENYNPLLGPGIDTGQFIYRRNVYNSIPLVFAKNACDWQLMKKIYEYFPNSFKSITDIVTRYSFHQYNRSNNNSYWHNSIVNPLEFKDYFTPFVNEYKIDLSPA